MSPDERRGAIVAATLPLLLERGPEVSTREIAQAAGVAEGTIFRVFETKQDLIHATIHAALQPDAVLAELASLPEGQPLVERVSAVLTALEANTSRTRALFATLFGGKDGGPPPRHGKPPGPPHEARLRIFTAAADALEPYADQLRISTAAAARILSAVAFAAGFDVSDSGLDDSHHLADLVLRGIAEGNQ